MFFEESDSELEDEMLVPEGVSEQENEMVEANMFKAFRKCAVERILRSGFLPQFFKYVTFLLSSEQNFNILNVLLNIVNRVISVPGVHVNTYLPLCLPGLVNCLDDQRVVVRRRALFLLRKLIKYLRKRQYFMNLLFFLEEASTNQGWHSKEELLNLVSILVLETGPREEWLHGPKELREGAKVGENGEGKRNEVAELGLEISRRPASRPTTLSGPAKSEVNSGQTKTEKVNFQRAFGKIAFFLDDSVAKVR
jgi:hypothetical protein